MRRKLLPSVVVATVAALAFVPTAQAAWKLTSAPDASFGGERTILAGQASQGLEIVALCNGQNRAFNLILPEWEKDLGGGRAMTVEIRNDSGAELTGSGTTFRSEAGDFTGIAFDSPERLEDIVRLIATAEASISIVSTNIDWGVSTTYYADVTQPLAEVEGFAEACGFAAIPVAAPKGPAPEAWTIELALGSSVSQARGAFGVGMEVEFSCDATTSSASLVLTRAAGAGGETMSEPVNATIVVDGGKLRTSPASINFRADGSVSIYYSDSALVPELLIDLAAAKAKLSLELYYPATGTYEEWETQGRVAVDAAKHLVEACGLTERPPLYVAPDPRLVPETPGTWKAGEQTLSSGNRTQTLTAFTRSERGRLIFWCDESNDISLTYVTDDLQRLPIRDEGQSISMTAEIAGLGYPIDLVLMQVEGNGGIFMSPSSHAVQSILAALRESPPELKLVFIDLTTDSDIHEETAATDNVAAEGDRFVSLCYAE